MDNSDPALDLLERDIAERLEPVCSYMSPESFRELVRDIVRVKMKYGLESLAGDEVHGRTADIMLTARVPSEGDQASEQWA